MSITAHVLQYWKLSKDNLGGYALSIQGLISFEKCLIADKKHAVSIALYLILKLHMKYIVFFLILSSDWLASAMMF